MSSASSTLGALAVLSIILATTAGTESDVTSLLGINITSTTSSSSSTSNTTKQPSTVAATNVVSGNVVVQISSSSTNHRALQLTNGTKYRVDVAASTTGTANSADTETTTTRRMMTSSSSSISSSAPARNGMTNNSHTGLPEITSGDSIAATLPITEDQTTEVPTSFKVKVTTPSPPRQERLVGLVENATDHFPMGIATTIDSSRDSTSKIPVSKVETTTTMTTMTTTTTTTTTTTRPMDFSIDDEMIETTIVMPVTIATPVLTATTSLMMGKSLGSSKSRNELLGETFHESKPAQKVNSVNQGHFGGKITSALGKYAPYFEDGQEELNVTARIGNTVVLDCEIGMLGNKTVTWSYHSADVIRLLTVGRNAYSVDQRISLYFRYPTNWRLRIQYATPRDSGLYECQVATYPPLVKKIHLLVTAPILVIMDDSGRIKSGERHLKAGSALRLRCEARDVPERYNETVIWTRGDEILSEDVSENRTTEYVDGREIQVIVSTIVVEKATPRHAGNYSCVVPEKAKTTVAVHVLNGELPAAVHDGNGVSRSVLNLWLIHLTVSYVFSR